MDMPTAPRSAPDPTTAPATTKTIAVRFGLINGLIGTVFSLVLFLTKLEQSELRWVGLLISIGCIYLAHTEFKKHNQGFLEYGQALGIGTTLSLIAGIIQGVFTYVYVSFIDTEFTQRMLDNARAQMEAQGNMDDAQIDQAVDMTANFASGGALLIFSIIFGAFFGFILSLIVGSFTKNSRPEFE
jgi:Protein of unknown function (DUF4199)